MRGLREILSEIYRRELTIEKAYSQVMELVDEYTREMQIEIEELSDQIRLETSSKI